MSKASHLSEIGRFVAVTAVEEDVLPLAFCAVVDAILDRAGGLRAPGATVVFPIPAKEKHHFLSKSDNPKKNKKKLSSKTIDMVMNHNIMPNYQTINHQ